MRTLRGYGVHPLGSDDASVLYQRLGLRPEGCAQRCADTTWASMKIVEKRTSTDATTRENLYGWFTKVIGPDMQFSCDPAKASSRPSRTRSCRCYERPFFRS